MAEREATSAVVMLSGGLDSATVAAIARNEGFRVSALSFDYGQRHRVELARARLLVDHLGLVEHKVVSIDLRAIGGSALTSALLEVPKEGLGSGIPSTYVPARNSIFLSIALGYAEVMGASDIYFGANALDYSGYPDCRPAFVEAFERLANIATKAGMEGRPFRIRAPLLHLTKPEIIRRGLELGVDFGLTHSCYDPVGERACGRCDSCRIRLAAFDAVGVRDPVLYVDEHEANTEHEAKTELGPR